MCWYGLLQWYFPAGKGLFAESTTGSSLYYERVDADFPATTKQRY